MIKVCYLILLLLFFGCIFNNLDEKKRSKKVKVVEVKMASSPLSYSIFRFNFIDDIYCPNCAPALFESPIPLNSVTDSVNIIGMSKNTEQVVSVYSLLDSAKKRVISKHNVNNRFVLSFSFENQKIQNYSYRGRGEWLLNDTLLMKPQEDIIEILRRNQNLGDLTDYRYAAEPPTAR